MNSLSLDNWFSDCFYADPSSKFDIPNKQAFYCDPSQNNDDMPDFMLHSSVETAASNFFDEPQQVFSPKMFLAKSPCFSSEKSESNFEPTEESNEFSKKSYLPKFWNKEHDDRLLLLGSQYKGAWKKISKKFDHKLITPKFLKYRFNELTCAQPQKRTRFEPSEDLMLVKYFKIYGPNWSEMATHFQNRTPVMLKNRYYSYIKNSGLIDSTPETNKNSEDEYKVSVEVECETLTVSNVNSASSNNAKLGFGTAVSESSPAVSSSDSLASMMANFNSAKSTPEDTNTLMSFMIEQIHLFQSLYLETKSEFNSLKQKLEKQGYKL